MTHHWVSRPARRTKASEPVFNVFCSNCFEEGSGLTSDDLMEMRLEPGFCRELEESPDHPLDERSYS